MPRLSAGGAYVLSRLKANTVIYDEFGGRLDCG